MAELHNSTVRLGEDLKVTVEVGEFENFQRVTRNDKFISLNEKLWSFLKNKIHTLATIFKNAGEWETFTTLHARKQHISTQHLGEATSVRIHSPHCTHANSISARSTQMRPLL